MEITQELVKELFNYKDGSLYWRVKPSPQVKVGDLAGTPTMDKKSDRIKISINRKCFKRSRLVFLFHHGWLPKVVDHIDRNPMNDNIANLRAATRSQNNMNMSCIRGLTSIYKGVYLMKNRTTWESSIKINGKRKYLGTFKIETDAAIAYNKAANELFGEFANLNIIQI